MWKQRAPPSRRTPNALFHRRRRSARAGPQCTKSRTRKIETMDKRAEYLSTMETQLKKWDADVDALAAEGEKASVEARAAYHKQVAELRTERDAARKTLE